MTVPDRHPMKMSPDGIHDAQAASGSKLALPTQIVLVSASLFVTVIACIAVSVLAIKYGMTSLRNGSTMGWLAQVFGFGIAAALLFGNIMHQVASLGHLKMRREEQPPDNESLLTLYDTEAPPLTFLVPSYKENLRIVRQTLLSAALQEYPTRRVVLLIDDPPYPSDVKQSESLLAACRLPQEIQMSLARQAHPLQTALDVFEQNVARDIIDRVKETDHIIKHYSAVSTWFLKQAASVEVGDHMDQLFVEGVYLKRARAHARHVEDLKRRQEAGRFLGEAELRREYTRLAALFRVELTSFNRKKFVNLSHELNKAMNLNSYIGLIGKSFRMVKHAAGIALQESDSQTADFTVPDAKYVVSLDADSLLMPSYLLHMIHTMEQPENKRLAVAQSPYVAIPGAQGMLERTAAATVAAQYVVHMGFNRYDSAFWVGANAVLRKTALDEIRTPIRERGFTMSKYIHDRTHIEDTESTIDLIKRGWTLYNSSEQFAYSATPDDFGSLLIQRRRWANGGLIILPKLLRYLFSGQRVPHRCMQGIMRIGYLINLSLGSLAVLATLIYPMQGSLICCLAAGGIGYALVYGADLLRMGFHVRDLPQVYALNLMMIPINLGGAAKSLHQAWSGKKTPFKRTPKTKGRTSVPLFYVAAEYALMIFCMLVSVLALAHGKFGHAIWALANAFVFVHIVMNLMNEQPHSSGPAVSASVA